MNPIIFGAMKATIISILILSLSFATLGQDTYRVFLKDKGAQEFDPFTFFDQKAIERRVALNIPIYSPDDIPVSVHYLTALSRYGDIIGKSRWLNLVHVSCSSCLENLKALPFVRSVEAIPSKTPPLLPLSSAMPLEESGDELMQFKQNLEQAQTERFGAFPADTFGNAGAGVRIAVIDVGFKNAHKNPYLSHLYDEGRIIKTWDFVRKKVNVDAGGHHGTMVLSCIGGIYDYIPLGLAYNAEYLLARTERLYSERLSEEIFWMEAVEWADQNGADIINSSLGYTVQRYFPEDMNGKTAYISQIANRAASKGILVVNAAGNEGEDPQWKTIGAPADADSVLSVGGIDPKIGTHIAFSSYGPTSDMRMKPNVSATGMAMVAKNQGLTSSFGTSFASPLVAGFAACVKALNPNLYGVGLKDIIEKSGDLHPYFDYAHGYGVPQTAHFEDSKKELPKNDSLLITKEENGFSISWGKSKFSVNQSQYTLNARYPHQLFYKAESNHHILFYLVVNTNGVSDSLFIHNKQLTGATKLTVFYEGNYQEYSID